MAGLRKMFSNIRLGSDGEPNDEPSCLPNPRHLSAWCSGSRNVTYLKGCTEEEVQENPDKYFPVIAASRALQKHRCAPFRKATSWAKRAEPAREFRVIGSRLPRIPRPAGARPPAPPEPEEVVSRPISQRGIDAIIKAIEDPEIALRRRRPLQRNCTGPLIPKYGLKIDFVKLQALHGTSSFAHQRSDPPVRARYSQLHADSRYEGIDGSLQAQQEHLHISYAPQVSLNGAPAYFVDPPQPDDGGQEEEIVSDSESVRLRITYENICPIIHVSCSSRVSMPDEEPLDQFQDALEVQVRNEDYLLPESSRLVDCVVCRDTKGNANFPLAPPTLRCQHPPQTCTMCLQAWMASEHATKGCQDIRCPECPETLEHDDFRRAASAATLAAYETHATQMALSADPNFRWCIGPGCGSGQLHIEWQGTYMRCQHCGFRQCAQHAVPWHEGETCMKYDKRRAKSHADEQRSEAMLDTVSKLCPNPKCGWRIQKVDGCDHVRCVKCRYSFC